MIRQAKMQSTCIQNWSYKSDIPINKNQTLLGSSPKRSLEYKHCCLHLSWFRHLWTQKSISQLKKSAVLGLKLVPGILVLGPHLWWKKTSSLLSHRPSAWQDVVHTLSSIILITNLPNKYTTHGRHLNTSMELPFWELGITHRQLGQLFSRSMTHEQKILMKATKNILKR